MKPARSLTPNDLHDALRRPNPPAQPWWCLAFLLGVAVWSLLAWAVWPA